MTQPLTASQQAHILKWALDRGLLSQKDIGLSTRSDAATLSESDLSDRFEALRKAGRLDGILETVLAEDHEATALASGGDPWVKAMG